MVQQVPLLFSLTWSTLGSGPEARQLAHPAPAQDLGHDTWQDAASSCCFRKVVRGGRNSSIMVQGWSPASALGGRLAQSDKVVTLFVPPCDFYKCRRTRLAPRAKDKQVLASDTLTVWGLGGLSNEFRWNCVARYLSAESGRCRGLFSK